MRFELSSAKYFIAPHDPNVPKLQELGFDLSEVYDSYLVIKGEPTIDVFTLQELIDLSTDIGSRLIVNATSIRIYNDYNE